MLQTAQKPAAQKMAKIRVMVVDDSAVIRGFIVRTLESDPKVEIAATCSNGQTAVLQLQRNDVDVIILDIEMPVMDGLTALPKLLAINPNVKIIIASTLSQRNAEISLRALSLGAADYLPKPSANKLGANEEFHRELLGKVHALGHRRHAQAIARPSSSNATAASAKPASNTQITLRNVGSLDPRILVIGSSTGGPQALMAVLKALPTAFEAPIVIAQHMPAAFTPILAQHLEKACGRPCAEATDGQQLRSGAVHLAPGDFHLELAGDRRANHLRLTKAPPENFCRPSVDPLLRSVVRCYGAQTVAVILTGMGSDGLESARTLAAAGGALIAQDEASSVVWGMPGAVAKAGLCSAVLPLSDIPKHVVRLFRGVQS